MAIFEEGNSVCRDTFFSAALIFSERIDERLSDQKQGPKDYYIFWDSWDNIFSKCSSNLETPPPRHEETNRMEQGRGREGEELLAGLGAAKRR